MGFGTIALQSPGDMGHAVGALLVERGEHVRSCLAGRSTRTRDRAARAGIETAASLQELLDGCDLVLSILPPAAAEAFADDCARTLRGSSRPPLFLDANAVAPATARRMAESLGAAGVPFADGGLVGAPPAPGRPATRLYVSGPGSHALRALAVEGERGAIDVRALGDAIGAASGLKMTYASITKGTLTLYTAALLSAKRLGVYEALATELAESQAVAWQRMQVIPFLPADAERWVAEMEEISATFAGAGAPEGFHRAAAEIFGLLADTPFAAETRESLDTSRTLEEAVRVFAELAAKRGD
jgi:3-hydroxyisobutyrate dehydrogenase-like beta-hydroxyacid dehydrogenase